MTTLTECQHSPIEWFTLFILHVLSQALHVCLSSCQFGYNLRKKGFWLFFLAAAVHDCFLGENRLVSNFASIPDS